VAYNDADPENKNGAYRDTGVDVEETEDVGGGYNVGFTEDGEWLEYTVDADAGTYDLEFRVAKKGSTGTMRVVVDGEERGTVTVPETGGWQTWETVTLEDISLDAGEHVVRLEFVDAVFTFNWFEARRTSGGGSDGDLRVDVAQVDRSGFPRVQAYVTAADGSGEPLTTLDEGDFEVSEDGTSQAVANVVSLGSGGSATDISTSLVIDNSLSMEGRKIASATAAASQFVDQLRGGDEAEIVSFDGSGDYVIAQRWTRAKGTLRSAIGSLSAAGDTPLWESAYAAVTEASPRTGRSAVILLTDGEDTEDPSPSRSLDDVIAEAQARNVPVYTIAFGSGPNADALRRLARETNGVYYEAPDPSDLADVYRRISSRLSNEYRVTYETSNAATDGTRRDVELAVRDGGQRGADTGSYVAPCAPLPDARFDYSASGRTVAFDGAASVANGGGIVEYRWDFDNDGRTDATGRRVSHTYGGAGSYEAKLTVEKGCGVVGSTVETVDIAGGFAVGLGLSTSNERVPVGGTRTVDVTVSGTGAGVGSYEVTVDTNDPRFEVVSATALGNARATDVSVAPDGSSVRIAAAGVRDTDLSTLARVTVRATAAGETTLDFGPTNLGYGDGSNDYTVDDLGVQTLRGVDSRPTLPGAAGPATDVDGDGLLEDTNGNGAFTLADVTFLFDRYGTGAVQPHPDAFDYNRNGEVTLADLTVLFGERLA
jgi:VWFA-related protein